MNAPLNPIRVGNKKIGNGESLYFIAEIGINHDGKLGQAKKLIEVAAAAEADAAKFQLFTAKNMYVHRKAAGTYELMGKKLSIYDLVASVEVPPEWLGELNDYCKQHGILFFSSIFDFHSLEIADKYMELFKFSSYDCTNLPLLTTAAKLKKPIIVSLGGATMREAAEVAETLQGASFSFMHCIAKYPAPLKYANLAVIPMLKQAFGCPAGFSDNGFVDDAGNIDNHIIPEAAAAAGADLFEIHITTDRKLPGPDHGFAAEPDELKRMVKKMQETRQQYNSGRPPSIRKELLGSSIRKTYDIEKYVRDFCYRQIFAIQPIKKGEKFTPKNISILRPGESKERGLEPKYYPLLLQAHASMDVQQWTAIQREHILS